MPQLVGQPNLLLLLRRIERPLHHIVNVRRNAVVAPQPTHHLGENRLQHLLAVPLNAPRVVHLVALFGERLLHADVLIEPIARLIVAAVGSQTPIIVPAIHQEHTQRLLIALADNVRIGISAANVSETTHVAQHFSEVVRPLPRHGESRNGPRTRPADAMALGIFRYVVLLVEHRKQLIHDDPRVLIVQGVVLGGPVRVAITPLAGGRLRLIGAAARIDKNSDHHRKLAAVDQVVHYNLRADIAFRSHESLPIVVDHQAGRHGRVVLRRHVDPVGMLRPGIGFARQGEGPLDLALRNSILRDRIGCQLVVDVRIRGLGRRLCERRCRQQHEDWRESAFHGFGSHYTTRHPPTGLNPAESPGRASVPPYKSRNLGIVPARNPYRAWPCARRAHIPRRSSSPTLAGSSDSPSAACKSGSAARRSYSASSHSASWAVPAISEGAESAALSGFAWRAVRVWPYPRFPRQCGPDRPPRRGRSAAIRRFAWPTPRSPDHTAPQHSCLQLSVKWHNVCSAIPATITTPEDSLLPESIAAFDKVVFCYDRAEVLHGISFALHRGEVVGLLGPNGAGKTTTIKIIAGILAPTAGGVSVTGLPLPERAVDVKQRIGYVPEAAVLFESLTGQDFLELSGRLHGVAEDTLQSRIACIPETFDLSSDRASRLDTYSKGMRQKILIAAALLHDPDLILLDEPLSGLDVNASIMIKDLIAALASAGKTILYSSHVLDVVEKVCNRVLIIHKGNLIADSTPENLKASTRQSTLEEVFRKLTHAESVNAGISRIVEALRS